jgi:CheY-like chemotaxis protein
MKNHTQTEKLHEAQKMEALGQLTGGIAHDFNNLLTVIRTNAENLQEDLKGQPFVHDADLILKAAVRGAALVQRLLAFARRQELRPQFVDLDVLMDSFVSLLRHTIEENIAIGLRKPAHISPISVDPNGLENALLNLAINSRDAMPDGGELLIKLSELEVDQNNRDEFPDLADGQYVEISISDTGTGMPSDVLAQATQPFFTTKAPGKGTGLGLSMVYGFAKQSQGAVRLRTEVNRGTTVSLYFPTAKPSERRAVGYVREPIDALRGTGHIILVEDDSLVRESTEGILRKLGYSVATAGKASEALAMLEHKPHPDLVFTDVIMPGGMNGVELVSEIHRRWPAVKTLLTSGYGKTEALGKITMPVGVRFLPKPYANVTLARTVRDLLSEL